MTKTRSELISPASYPVNGKEDCPVVCLELKNGSVFEGFGFGAKKSVAGELVFQTGKKFN